MRTLLALFLIIAMCSCGHKPESHAIVVWQTPSPYGCSLDIMHTTISEKQFARILEMGTEKFSDTSLELCLLKGVGVSNAFGPLALAEKYGITNITLRLDQIRPPMPTNNSDRFID